MSHLGVEGEIPRAALTTTPQSSPPPPCKLVLFLQRQCSGKRATKPFMSHLKPIGEVRPTKAPPPPAEDADWLSCAFWPISKCPYSSTGESKRSFELQTQWNMLLLPLADCGKKVWLKRKKTEKKKNSDHPLFLLCKTTPDSECRRRPCKPFDSRRFLCRQEKMDF